MKKSLFIFFALLTFKLSAQFNCNSAKQFCSGTTYTDSTIPNNTSTAAGMSFGCITNFNHNCYYYGQAQYITDP